MLVAATVVILLLVSGLQWWQASVATDRLRQETLSQAHLRAAQVTSAASELVTILLVGVDATSRELVQTYLTRKGKEFEAGVRQAVEHLLRPNPQCGQVTQSLEPIHLLEHAVILGEGLMVAIEKIPVEGR